LLPLFAPKLTSMDINAQSNTLKLLKPQMEGLSKLTSLKYSLSDHYTVCNEDALVLSALAGLKSLYVR